jgi:organic hydroperoxide reductase OsmC/OhrA
VQDLPHRYAATASAESQTNIRVDSPGLQQLEVAGPAEFGGPGDLWSPETQLVASVAGCFILSFRAIARASNMEWHSLQCEVVGELDKVERVTRFTRFHVRARLEVPTGIREDRPQRLLEKAERSCLITNSLKAPTHLDTEIVVK